MNIQPTPITARTPSGTMPDDDDLAPRILVVVPTLNEARAIKACLTSLLKEAPATLELIVADGGSTDATRDIIAEFASTAPHVRLIDNPGRDQIAAVNLVARIGDPSRDILIRCDAHAVYPAGYILGVARGLISSGADSIVVPMDAIAAKNAPAFARANAVIVDTLLGSGGSAHRGGHKSGWIDHGHHAGMWRKTFADMGGYDPAMVGNEDAEFDTRLNKRGGKIWLESSLRIQYFPRATPGALFRQYRRYGAGRARHLLTHGKKPRLRQMIPVAHVFALAVSLAALGTLNIALAYPMLYATALIAATLWAFSKFRDKAMAWTPIVLGIMHTAWGVGFIAEAIRFRSKPA